MSEDNKLKKTVGGIAKIFGMSSDTWLLDAANILEQMPVALFVTDSAGAIKYANRRGCKTFEFDHDELSGKSIRDLLPSTGGHPATPEHPGTMTIKSEELGCRKSGDKFPVSLHLRKIGPKDAQMTLIAVEDLTRERELEQLKHDFLAMISHDLRAPLSAVSGNVSLLKDGTYGNLPDPALKTLQETDETIRRMVKLVNDLLQLEKMSASGFSLDKQPTRIADFFEPALSMIAPEADRRDITFVFQTAHVGDRTVVADKDRIVQVLVNLMANAVKYSPAESTVTVRCDLSGEFLKVNVEDDGPGIPESARTAIFEKYKQLSEGETNRGGAGLGLAICKLIVEQHGGTIGVDCTINKPGSTFWFTLPL